MCGPSYKLTHEVKCHIFSWGSGANPWGHDKEDQFAAPNHYDGMLEVVGVGGVIHLGQIQSGFRSGIRIAQVKRHPFNFTLTFVRRYP